MQATRTINKIRYGRKSGPMTAYIYQENLSELNPFVLWDHFDANGIKEETGLDYHGHSGIEAFSYPVTGTLHHMDSCGCSVTMQTGDLQIMTTGKGIVHKDTMQPLGGRAESFALWTALPAGEREMADASSQYIGTGSLPLVEEMDTTTKVLIGEYKQAKSPLSSSIPVTYLDIMIAPYGGWYWEPDERLVSGFVYMRSGSVYIGANQLYPQQMGILNPSKLPIHIKTSQKGARLFLILGEPLNQPMLSSGSSVHSNPENLHQGSDTISALMANHPVHLADPS
ncbi:pirin family protein [Photobacterium sp. 1_MG-2023]|uniref:pirin family protein n=1 Tax=Photobacterium sp. 1_MG-2023 TaxID=3062646 RepID=UPI0026E46378|nr:pirin family protein [Photobacterium sp. 1_MG-2023]MDO6705641.1 pirin family protein [Photobacterium sp. 1_MG-2023]